MSATFLILRRNKKDMIKNVYWSSCKVLVDSCQILMKLEFSRHIFGKNTHIKFHENPVSGSRGVPRVQTDRHDEAKSRFLQFCKRV